MENPETHVPHRGRDGGRPEQPTPKKKRPGPFKGRGVSHFSSGAGEIEEHTSRDSDESSNSNVRQTSIVDSGIGCSKADIEDFRRVFNADKRCFAGIGNT